MGEYIIRQISDLPEEFLEKAKFAGFREVAPDRVMDCLLIVYLDFSIHYTQNTDFQNFLQRLETAAKRQRQDPQIVYELAQCPSIQDLDRAVQSPRVHSWLQLVAEDLMGEGERNFSGNPLYNIYAQSVGVNIKVVQMLDPNSHIDFEFNPSYLTLYILESNTSFNFLYPGPEHYARVWENNLPQLIPKNCQHCNRVVEFEEKICMCVYCTNCVNLLKTSQAAQCTHCKTDLTYLRQYSNQIVPETANGVKSKLESYVNDCKNFIDSCDANQEICLNKLKEVFAKQKETVNRQLNACVAALKSLEHSPNEQLRQILSRNWPEASQSVQPLDIKINENYLENIIVINWPDVFSVLSMNRCALCASEQNLFKYECQCLVCAACVLSNENEAKFRCLSCKRQLDSSNSIQDFINNQKIARREELRNNSKLCMNCGSEADQNLLLALECSCRVCFTCIFESLEKCPSCNQSFSRDQIHKLNVYFGQIGMTKGCAQCNQLKSLVCGCSCADCSTPVSRTCHMCKIEFEESFYLRNAKKRCEICLKSLSASKIFRGSCGHEFCSLCFKRNHGVFVCPSCRKFFRESERKEIDKTFGETGFRAVCLNCGKTDNMACECSCQTCASIYTEICPNCNVRRKRNTSRHVFAPNESSLSLTSYTQICNKCTIEAMNMPSVCSRCSICIECLKKHSTYNERCPGCYRFYNEYEKTKRNLAIRNK